MGKLLTVDLSAGRIDEERLDSELCQSLIGGYGIGAKLLYERVGPGCDPLGPENILGFFTGPLTGTPALGGSRYTVVGKSPLTGTWGDGNSGGTWGPTLKFAGYDGVLVKGISDSPAYLFIDDGRAELHDASWLWGKDTNETDDLLRERLGQGIICACIGPAGEKLARIACIINNKGRAIGRSGFGAVMGSKKLKAVVVRGNAKVPIADEQQVLRLRRQYMHQAGGWYESLRTNGSIGALSFLLTSGRSPIKNWTGTQPPDFPQAVETFDTEKLHDKYLVKKYGCWHCNIACGGFMEVKEGPYAGLRTHKPEYEIACAFGPLCLNDNVPSLIKCNDLVNRAGLDGISAPCTIAFAIECYENGIISKSDTGGLELTWGNYTDMIKLLEQMGNREGFGDTLADGVMRAAERIGKGSEQFAIHMNGQEVPMHDPRQLPDMVVTYKMDATPGRHTQGGDNWPLLNIDLPELNPYQYAGRGERKKKEVTLVHALQASGSCLYTMASYPYQYLPDFLSAVTGWQYTIDDCFTIGERIANLRHAFNLREGHNPLQRKTHPRIIGIPPLTDGPTKGVTVDEDTMVREYCQAMAWDPVTAKPSPERLEELGIGFLIKDLAGC